MNMKNKIKEEDNKKIKLHNQIKSWIILLNQRKITSILNKDLVEKIKDKRIVESKMLIKCRILFLWRRFLKRKGANPMIRILSNMIQ